MIRHVHLEAHEPAPRDWIVFGTRKSRHLPTMRFLTIHFPWKCRMYSISEDEVVLDHPYWHFQFFVHSDFGDRKLKLPEEMLTRP